MTTAVVFRDGPTTVVVIGADVVGLTTDMADRIRARAGDVVECDPAIGTAVRRASPAPVTIFAGYSQGSLGYVATPDEYPFGGYEPAVSHRSYRQPAPFSPEVAGIIERTALELLEGLFA